MSITQVELRPWGASLAVDMPSGSTKPDVLLLHSEQGPDSARALQTAISSAWNPVAPIHPGFGGQPRIDGIDAVRDLAYAYLDMLDRIGVSTCALVGCSLGAWVGLEMAAMDPGRFPATCLISPIGVKLKGTADSEFAEIMVESAARMGEILYHDANADLWKDRTSTEHAVRRAEEREALLHYAWEPYLHNPKLRHVMARVRGPVMVIAGDSDGLVEPAYFTKFASELGDAALKSVPKAGHYPEVECPEETAALVSGFLSESIGGHDLVTSGAAT